MSEMDLACKPLETNIVRELVPTRRLERCQSTSHLSCLELNSNQHILPTVHLILASASTIQTLTICTNAYTTALPKAKDATTSHSLDLHWPQWKVLQLTISEGNKEVSQLQNESKAWQMLEKDGMGKTGTYLQNCRQELLCQFQPNQNQYNKNECHDNLVGTHKVQTNTFNMHNSD